MAALKTKLKIKGSIKTGGFSYSSMFFHLSLVGMLVGLLVSVLFGFYGKIIITEGQVLPQQAASYQSVQKGIWASWPDFTYSLGLDTTEVRYQPGMAEPTDLSAQLIIMQNDNLNTSTTLKPNHSFNYEGVNIALEDFGLAPKVQLVGEDGQQEEMYVNLIWDTKDGIVYIGKDVVDLPGRALKISLKVYPDAKFLPDGTLTTISNELKAPAVWVEVNARGKSVFQGPALLGQKMRCSNGMVVIVPEIRKWVSLIIKRDLGYLIMLVFAVSSAIALGLAVLCPPYKLEFGENQLCWFTDKHPHLLLDKLQN